MIKIVGDTWEELANLQGIIESGVLNCHGSLSVNVSYKLSSGNIILTDKYNHIVGSKEKNDWRNCKKWETCPCGKNGHKNKTSMGYSIGKCKKFEPYFTL